MHLGATEQKVIAVPDVVRTRVVRGDICLICCDGIWDVMSSKEVRVARGAPACFIFWGRGAVLDKG